MSHSFMEMKWNVTGRHDDSSEGFLGTKQREGKEEDKEKERCRERKKEKGREKVRRLRERE